MNLLKKQLVLITATLFTMLVFVAGQPNIDLNYQGMLADIQGKKINNEQFDLNVKLMSESDQTIYWETSSSTHTDEDGWFGFTISDISQFLMKDGQIKKAVVIRMEFLPNTMTKWMREGDDFMVSYTLSPTIVNNDIHLKMTRMEGSELVIHSEDHLYAFKDQYPFAYLTSGFLLTDQPPVSSNSVADLKQWLSPDDKVEEGVTSRGVKGGFPAGGYRKKN